MYIERPPESALTRGGAYSRPEHDLREARQRDAVIGAATVRERAERDNAASSIRAAPSFSLHLHVMIEPSRKELLEAGREALELGVLEAASVRRFADQIIATDEHPPRWAIEISLEEDRQVMIDLLRAVPGEADIAIVLKLLFAQICRSVKQRRLTYRETTDEFLRCYLRLGPLDRNDAMELQVPALNCEQYDACRFQSNDGKLIEQALSTMKQSVDMFLTKYQPFEAILAGHFG